MNLPYCFILIKQIVPNYNQCKAILKSTQQPVSLKYIRSYMVQTIDYIEYSIDPRKMICGANNKAFINCEKGVTLINYILRQTKQQNASKVNGGSNPFEFVPNHTHYCHLTLPSLPSFPSCHHLPLFLVSQCFLFPNRVKREYFAATLGKNIFPLWKWLFQLLVQTLQFPTAVNDQWKQIWGRSLCMFIILI